MKKSFTEFLNEEKEFKVGDKVKLNPKTPYMTNLDSIYGKDIVGVIVDKKETRLVSVDYSYDVKFDNKVINLYANDLIKA